MLCPCGTTNDNGHLVCTGCYTPLSLSRVAAKPAGSAGPPKTAKVVKQVPPTRKVQTDLRVLTLEFPHGTVTVTQGGHRRLGRDTRYPDADLFAGYDTVSTHHAVLELRADGTAWISDNHSTNSTFVNEAKLTPDQPHPLRSGDQVRFADLLRATVRLT